MHNKSKSDKPLRKILHDGMMLIHHAKKRVDRLLTKLTTYLHIQLFITLFSWPLLLAWGLPLSRASMIGNLIFAPFLSLFLLLSSLIFFCELLSVPNGAFIILLEWLTGCWSSLLALGQRSWLLAFPAPPLIIDLLLPLTALLILQYKKLLTPAKNIGALALLTLATGFMLKTCFITTEPITTIPCFDDQLTILRSEGATALIDHGSLGRRVSAPSFVTTTLIPTLIKQGASHLDVVILTKPSTMVFRAAAALIEHFQVTAVVLPSWRGSLKNSGWQAWQQLISTAQKQNTRFIHVTEDTQFDLGTQKIQLTVSNNVIKKNNLSYHPITIKYSCIDVLPSGQNSGWQAWQQLITTAQKQNTHLIHVTEDTQFDLGDVLPSGQNSGWQAWQQLVTTAQKQITINY